MRENIPSLGDSSVFSNNMYVVYLVHTFVMLTGDMDCLVKNFITKRKDCILLMFMFLGNLTIINQCFIYDLHCLCNIWISLPNGLISDSLSNFITKVCDEWKTVHDKYINSNIFSNILNYCNWMFQFDSCRRSFQECVKIVQYLFTCIKENTHIIFVLSKLLLNISSSQSFKYSLLATLRIIFVNFAV